MTTRLAAAPVPHGVPTRQAITLGHQLRRPLAWTVLLSVAMNLLVLAPALFMLQVFDRVLVSRSHDTLVVLLAGTGLALLVLLALDFVRTRLQGLLGQMVGDALAPAVAQRVISGVAQRCAGATTALRDVSTVRRFFSAHAVLALFDAPWLVVYVGLIALAHPLLGLAAAVAAGLMLGLAVLNSLLTRRLTEQGQTDQARAQEWLEGSLRNAEVSQALGLSAALLARWATMNEDMADQQRPNVGRAAAMAAAARALRQAVQVGMLAVGAWLVIEQSASPGAMIAATVLLGRALAPVEQVVASWPLLVEGRAAWQRLETLLAGGAAAAERMALPAPAGRLSVRDVSFRPADAMQPTLAGVTLELAPGEALAIIGPSGSGKSTLARLLVGVWHPHAGTVRLDGIDLRQWPRAEVGPSIGYVPQDIQLFAGTVAENIARLGEVDSARVLAAARRAGAHEAIVALRDGYETRIDPQGALISPGQRQRIALARALYGEPKLLVLDEPNASLDGDGELALAEALRALRGEVTVVAVTHRSHLVRHMDRLLVLEAGRVKLHGPVAEVLAAMANASPRTGPQVVPLAPRDIQAGAVA